ncbi:hypothetical protein RIF29_21226 [Crotalaria pallida]|uniref:Uncharacterized protein n=1 Tax=Crotalaria pallida TaxID=3830 RepID=A0AAN9ID74_CROPI
MKRRGLKFQESRWFIYSYRVSTISFLSFPPFSSSIGIQKATVASSMTQFPTLAMTLQVKKQREEKR